MRSLHKGWYYERGTQAGNTKTPMTPWIEEPLDVRVVMSQSMLLSSLNFPEFEVLYGDRKEIVNLQNKTCTFGEFVINQFPCAHAIAACRDQNITYYVLCSKYYTCEALVTAYVESIYPANHHMKVPDEICKSCITTTTLCNEDGRRKYRCRSGGADLHPCTDSGTESSSIAGEELTSGF